MTIQLHCDGPDCTVVMANDAEHLSVAIENENLEPTMIDDDGEPYGMIALKSIGYVADAHFCGAQCLAAWAMDREMNRAH
jgi:hypothetical protein